jgi:hypothetical protein
VRSGIGGALQTLHINVLNEAMPESMIELLEQLDRPSECRHKIDKA